MDLVTCIAHLWSLCSVLLPHERVHFAHHPYVDTLRHRCKNVRLAIRDVCERLGIESSTAAADAFSKIDVEQDIEATVRILLEKVPTSLETQAPPRVVVEQHRTSRKRARGAPLRKDGVDITSSTTTVANCLWNRGRFIAYDTTADGHCLFHALAHSARESGHADLLRVTHMDMRKLSADTLAREIGACEDVKTLRTYLHNSGAWRLVEKSETLKKYFDAERESGKTFAQIRASVVNTTSLRENRANGTVWGDADSTRRLRKGLSEITGTSIVIVVFKDDQVLTFAPSENKESGNRRFILLRNFYHPNGYEHYEAVGLVVDDATPPRFFIDDVVFFNAWLAIDTTHITSHTDVVRTLKLASRFQK